MKKENLIRQERRYGAFTRSISLPAGLNADKTEAVFENGVLTLHSNLRPSRSRRNKR